MANLALPCAGIGQGGDAFNTVAPWGVVLRGVCDRSRDSLG